MKRSRPIVFASLILAGVGSSQAQQPRLAVRDSLQPPPVVLEGLPLPAPEILPGASPVVSEPVPVEMECLDCGPLTKNPRRLKKKCAWQASHWGYPEEFAFRPFGSFVQMAGARQIENGLAAQLQLYRFDFAALDGEPSAHLNTHGRLRLLRLAQTLSCTPHPLVVEYDADTPRMNELRRKAVLAELRKFDPEIADEQVVVRIPSAYGLQAEEGIILQKNLLNQTQNGGSQSAGSSQGGQINGANSSQGQGSSGSGSMSPISNSGTARY